MNKKTIHEDIKVLNVKEGRLFFWVRGLRLICVELNTGKVLWDYEGK